MCIDGCIEKLMLESQLHVHGACTQVFADTLEKKQASIGGIQDLVEILSAKDGIKKNGASDVESR